MSDIVMPSDVYQRVLDLSDQFERDGGCLPIERCIDGIVEAMRTGGIFLCRRGGDGCMNGVVKEVRVRVDLDQLREQLKQRPALPEPRVIDVRPLTVSEASTIERNA